MIKTNWCIITGAPGSGKTKVIERLSFLGYRVCPEVARLLVDEYNSNDKSFDYYSLEFENEIFHNKKLAEERFDKNELVFFDRSPIDSIVYSKFYNKPNEFQKEIKFRYNKVFFFEALCDYDSDDVRVQTKGEAKKIAQLIKEVYGSFGYELISVPRDSINMRADFILSNII